MSAFQPQPLTARQDPLNVSKSEANARKSCWRLTSRLGPELQLELPIYSRLLHCNSMSPSFLEGALVQSLAKQCDDFSVLWAGSHSGAGKAHISGAPIDSSMRNWRIQTIGIDEPVDVTSLNTAAAIQLQLYGSGGNVAVIPSRHAAWAPGLPVELSSYEHLAAKVDAIRGCLAEGKPIGAAVIPNAATIYEDVRFLIDAGFDWLEIVQAPHYALKQGAYLEFVELQVAMAKAVKAKQDSRTQFCPLWLTSSASDPADLVRFIDQGFEGVCIDSYLASRAPAQVAVRDMLAGIRVQSIGQNQPDYSWIGAALSDLDAYFRDIITFRM